MKKYRIETKCVQSGYKAGSGEPQVPPVVQSTTYRYYDGTDVAKLFDLQSDDFMYSRLGSPTVSFLEKKMAELEGGTAAVAASSGQSANLMAILNICEAGDHIISTSAIYGGTHNLFKVTLKKMGIDTTFVDPCASEEELLKAAKPKTKLLFSESLGNPTLTVTDFDKFRRASDKLGVPLMVDNTLASPYLCRPIEHGAHIVVHSTTKYCDGHATSVGGVVVESGTFPWDKYGNKYKGMTEPDDSYHGLKFYETFGDTAFSVKLRAQMLRDMGCTMSPMNAFLTLQGLDTLHLRMERHSENALKLAEYLESHPKVQWIRYPGLKKDPYHQLGKKYLPKGCGGVLSFGIKGGRSAGETFLKNIDLTSLVVHVGDIRTSVLHPASSTHRQLSEVEQEKAGIDPGLIRISVGIENIEDIIDDFETALNRV